MQEQSHHSRRGIYLLPNLFTTASLFAGFFAITSAMHDRFEEAAVAIFIAMVLDGMDGRVARLTHTQSNFGAQYDSLVDMVSFGLAPALVIYQWGLSGMSKWGWLGAFVYTAGTALRLARFNAQSGTADKRYFQGLASPSAAALVAGFVWLGTELGLRRTLDGTPALVVTLLAGLLMVSNFRYHSFKEIDFRGKVPFLSTVLLMLIFALIYVDPPVVLFTLSALYACSGPILTLIQLRRTRAMRRGQSRPG